MRKIKMPVDEWLASADIKSKIRTSDPKLCNKILDSVFNQKEEEDLITGTLDLYYLLGIRNVKGDIPVTEEEKHHYQSLLATYDENFTNKVTIEVKIRRYNQLIMSSHCFLENLGYVLSCLYPKEKVFIDVNIWEHGEIEEDWYPSNEVHTSIYLAGNVASICFSHYDLYNVFGCGLGLILIEPSAKGGHLESIIHIGDCLEVLGYLDRAARQYSLVNNTYTMKKTLEMFDSGKAHIDQNTLIRLCNDLIEVGQEEGYLYLSRYYRGCYELNTDCDFEKTIDCLNEGINQLKNPEVLIIEKAFVLDNFGKTKKDRVQSHKLYCELMRGLYTTAPYQSAAKYYYVLQLINGIGCKKNIRLAVSMLINMYFNDSLDEARKLLIDIYTNDETFKSPGHASIWKSFERGERNLRYRIPLVSWEPTEKPKPRKRHINKRILRGLKINNADNDEFDD